MKHFFHRLASAVLAGALLLTLAGCGGSGTISFTWFVEEIPANLDPQIASNPEDIIACKNLCGGLVRLGPDGNLNNDLCESWEVSSDGLTYTFHLKDGLTYTAAKGEETEYAITAEDFVFAFRRIFQAQTASPYAADFSAIANSAAVLAGQMPETALGVYAPDPLTLVFTLSERDDNFVSKLTLPGAMPCDEEFFESTRGTYGLTTKSTLSSGSFYIYNWTSSGLFLRRAPGENLVDSLRLVQNTTATAQTPEQLILNERCSAVLDESADPTALQSISYSDTTWALLFNCEGVLNCIPLRQALAAVALNADLIPDSPLYSPVTGLVPEGLTVDGLDYRSQAGDLIPTLGDGYGLYMQALQQLEASDIKDITLLLPADPELAEIAGQLNSLWQKELSLYFSIEQVEQEELETRLAEGDYTIALAPIQAESNSVYGLLSRFGAEGLTGYDDLLYALHLDESLSATGAARCALLAGCEEQLLSDCAAVPLFAQQKRLLLADGVEGLVFDPYGPVLDLTYTTKK